MARSKSNRIWPFVVVVGLVILMPVIAAAPWLYRDSLQKFRVEDEGRWVSRYIWHHTSKSFDFEKGMAELRENDSVDSTFLQYWAPATDQEKRHGILAKRVKKERRGVLVVRDNLSVEWLKKLP